MTSKQDLLDANEEFERELALLYQRLDAVLERGFRRVIVMMTSLMIVGYTATVLAILLR